MKKLQLLALAMLFAVAGTEFAEAKGACGKGKEWRKGKCRRKRKSRKAAPTQSIAAPSSSVIAAPTDTPKGCAFAKMNAISIAKNSTAIAKINKKLNNRTPRTGGSEPYTQYGPDSGIVGPITTMPVDPRIRPEPRPMNPNITTGGLTPMETRPEMPSFDTSNG